MCLTERRVMARLALKATAHAVSRGAGGAGALDVVTRVGGAEENGSSSPSESAESRGRLLSMLEIGYSSRGVYV